MKFFPRVDYNPISDVTTIRGLTVNLEPYQIEIDGGRAYEWLSQGGFPVILPNTEVERVVFRATRKSIRHRRYVRGYRNRGRRMKEAGYFKWLQGKPAIIRQLANRFPYPGRRFIFESHGDRNLWLLGFTEGGMLIMSTVDPVEHYEEAQKNPVYVCAEHLVRVRK